MRRGLVLVSKTTTRRGAGLDSLSSRHFSHTYKRFEQHEAPKNGSKVPPEDQQSKQTFTQKMLMPRNVLLVGILFLSGVFINERMKKTPPIVEKHEKQGEVDPDRLEITDLVYFDIEYAKQPMGRIVLGLYGKQAPNTVKNFVELSSRKGEVTLGTVIEPQELGKYGYKGSFFHRVIPRFMIQGGDFLRHNGTGSYSIYGAQFADETFAIPHFTGCLSMANSGKNSNGSQFFITTAPTPWLDNKHVVFGKVVQGFDVVRAIEAVDTDPKSNRPMKPVRIAQCGTLPVDTNKRKL